MAQNFDFNPTVKPVKAKSRKKKVAPGAGRQGPSPYPMGKEVGLPFQTSTPMGQADSMPPMDDDDAGAGPSAPPMGGPGPGLKRGGRARR